MSTIFSKKDLLHIYAPLSTAQLLKGVKCSNDAYDEYNYPYVKLYHRCYKINNKKIYSDSDKIGKQVDICLLYFMRNYKIMLSNIVSLSVKIYKEMGKVEDNIDFIYYLVIKCKTDSNNIEGIDFLNRHLPVIFNYFINNK